MIAQLKGRLAHRDDKLVILDVGGVGYRLFVSTDTLARLPADGETAVFWTHLAVREDALDLYGFLDKAELDYFQLLIGISGVGPKSALSILSLAPPETLRRAILAGDTGYLTRVSGIGRKSAEKIVLELKDKLGKIADEEAGDLGTEADALDALRALGYTPREAREALGRVPAGIVDTSERIREALKSLGK